MLFCDKFKHYFSLKIELMIQSWPLLYEFPVFVSVNTYPCGYSRDIQYCTRKMISTRVMGKNSQE